jgi:hypothetical protein
MSSDENNVSLVKPADFDDWDYAQLHSYLDSSLETFVLADKKTIINWIAPEKLRDYIVWSATQGVEDTCAEVVTRVFNQIDTKALKEMILIMIAPLEQTFNSNASVEDAVLIMMRNGIMDIATEVIKNAQVSEDDAMALLQLVARKGVDLQPILVSLKNDGFMSLNERQMD